MQKKTLISFLIIFIVTMMDGVIPISYVYGEEQSAVDLTILKNRIMEVFKEESLIIFACEGAWGGLFETARYYVQYRKTTKEPTYDGFYVWVLENILYKEKKSDEFGALKDFIANRENHPIYIMIKYNYELLLKLNEGEK